jgi:hypothetical protein
MKKNSIVIIVVILAVLVSWALIFLWWSGSIIPTEPDTPQIQELITEEDSALSLQTTSIEIEQGEWDSILSRITNLEGNTANYRLTTGIFPEEGDLVCYVYEITDIVYEFSLDYGESQDFTLIVQDQDINNKGTFACNLELFKDEEKIEDFTVLIEII